MSKPPRLSIVVPAFNEEENVAQLVEEIGAVLSRFEAGAELVLVNDGSTDATAERCRELMPQRPWLRLLSMSRNVGQSAAFHAGIRAAQGELIGMLDADLQNDPADLPAMVEALDARQADWVQGNRQKRQDSNTIVRTFSTWVGRTFRAKLLNDKIRDTGCSCRVFKRAIGLQLPLQYKGMHRFMPVYARRLGYQVIEMDVNHRARAAGEAKYGMWNRALPGLRDLFAARWMFNRLRPVTFTEQEPQSAPHVEIPKAQEQINA